MNPTFMIGPYDTKPSSGKIVLMGLKNKLVFCPPGGKNFVCVKDVARGIVKAINHGVNGEAYLMANENLSFYQFFKILKKQADKNFTIIKIPKGILLFVGFCGSMLRYLNIKTNFSSENMKALCINNYYSNSKAKTNLGMVFNPISKGIKESVLWFRFKQIN